MKLKVQHIVSLPDHDYPVGMIQWRGRCIIAADSGRIYEVVAVDGGEQYQLRCLGYALDTLGESL